MNRSRGIFVLFRFWHSCRWKTEACTSLIITAIISQPLPLKSSVLQHWGTFIFYLLVSLAWYSACYLGSSRLGNLPRGSCTVPCNAVLCAYSYIFIMARLDTWERKLCLRLHFSLLYGVVNAWGFKADIFMAISYLCCWVCISLTYINTQAFSGLFTTAARGLS